LATLGRMSVKLAAEVSRAQESCRSGPRDSTRLLVSDLAGRQLKQGLERMEVLEAERQVAVDEELAALRRLSVALAAEVSQSVDEQLAAQESTGSGAMDLPRLLASGLVGRKFKESLGRMEELEAERSALSASATRRRG